MAPFFASGLCFSCIQFSFLHLANNLPPTHPTPGYLIWVPWIRMFFSLCLITYVNVSTMLTFKYVVSYVSSKKQFKNYSEDPPLLLCFWTWLTLLNTYAEMLEGSITALFDDIVQIGLIWGFHILYFFCFSFWLFWGLGGVWDELQAGDYWQFVCLKNVLGQSMGAFLTLGKRDVFLSYHTPETFATHRLAPVRRAQFHVFYFMLHVA